MNAKMCLVGMFDCCTSRIMHTVYWPSTHIIFVYHSTILMQLSILEMCVDEILDFGEEAAAMYADHPVCAPASKSYFHYILNSCMRHTERAGSRV